MRTFRVLPRNVEKKWYIIDAKNKPLGKVAVKAAMLLRGKHKPEFTPNYDLGDYVVIVNAAHAYMSGKKTEQKMYYRHSGYIGSLKSENYATMVQRKPLFPMEHAVKGMLPHNRLGRELFRHLKVYADDQHAQHAQKPELIEV